MLFEDQPGKASDAIDECFLKMGQTIESGLQIDLPNFLVEVDGIVDIAGSQVQISILFTYRSEVEDVIGPANCSKHVSADHRTQYAKRFPLNSMN